MAIYKKYITWELDPKKRKDLISARNRKNKVETDSRSSMMPKKILAIVQARTTSTRFPNKIYEDLGGAPILYHVMNRVNLASYITTAVVASTEELDTPEGVPLFKYDGSTQDVLSRYYFCAMKYNADYIVRITSDCPVIDPLLIDYVVFTGLSEDADYCSNVLNFSFPDGQDVEFVSRKLLVHLFQNMHSDYDREHVTIGFRRRVELQRKFRTVSVINEKDFSDVKCSVDRREDINKIKKLGLI